MMSPVCHVADLPRGEALRSEAGPPVAVSDGIPGLPVCAAGRLAVDGVRMNRRAGCPEALSGVYRTRPFRGRSSQPAMETKQKAGPS